MTSNEFSWIQQIRARRAKKVLKSKIYLKPQEKPPEGFRIQRGPKGGLYYETEVKIAPSEMPKLEYLSHDTLIEYLSNLDQRQLYLLIHHKDCDIRRLVAKKVNQKGLHHLMKDEDEDVRIEVARKIDQRGLHQLIDDENFDVRVTVAERIDQKGLHQMMTDKDANVREEVAKRIDTKGLKKFALTSSRAGDIANKRLIRIAKINGMIKHYNKTEEIELTSDMKNQISKIVEDETGSRDMIELIDEFYKHTPFDKFHRKSKDAWEGSSSAKLSGLLKDSILRQFGGKIRHHNAVTDWKKFTEDLYAQYPKEMVDKYVQTHKKLTRKILDVMFPDQDTITLYRGTTTDELFAENEKIKIRSNPLSSWTLKLAIAAKFGEQKYGRILKATFLKDDIWSTFMSHAYQGMEREFLIISPVDRDGEVIK